MKKKSRSRATIGDILEIRVEGGLAYALFTHVDPIDPKGSGLIRIWDGIFDTRPEPLDSLPQRPVQFSSYVAVSKLIDDGLMIPVGHIDIPPALAKPPQFKSGMPGRPPNYWTCLWTIEDYSGEWRRVGKLPAHSVRLPNGGFCGFGLITYWIQHGRSPADRLVPDNIDWEADIGGPDVLDGIAGLATWINTPCPLPRAGDLIEIAMPGGLAYGLVSHDHKTSPCWGPLLRVFRGLHKRRPRNLSDIVHGEEQFATFTLITEAIRRGLMTVVENLDVPERLRDFPPFKRQLRTSKNRTSAEQVHYKWLVWTGDIDRDGNVTLDVLDKLPRKHVNASIKEVVLPEKLIRRIESGWRPEADEEVETVEDDA